MMGIFKIRGDLRGACGGFVPLALFALVVNGLSIAYFSYQIYTVIDADNDDDDGDGDKAAMKVTSGASAMGADTVINLIVACFILLLNLIAVTLLLLTHRLGSQLLYSSTKMIVFVTLIDTVMRLIDGCLAQSALGISLASLRIVLIAILAPHCFSVMKSLGNVLEAAGTGWECRNAADIQAARKIAQFQDN